MGKSLFSVLSECQMTTPTATMHADDFHRKGSAEFFEMKE